MSSEYKYVWLNLLTGKFSNSFTKEELDCMNKNEMVKVNEVDSNFVLIKYRSLSEETVTFSAYHKISVI